MRIFSYIVTTLMLLMMATLAHAVRVNSVYQAEIPVQSQSAEEKAKAAQQGLEQVLIKVSGNSQILNSDPVLKASLSKAEKLAVEYRYSTKEGKSKSLTIRYDMGAVNKLLQDAGVPTWGTNRPLTVVWLAFEGPNHSPDIVDSSADIQADIKHAAKQRGIPVILPVMDVTDLGLVSVNDVMSTSVTPLMTASQRYNGDALLIGHVLQVNDDDFRGQWRLVIGTDQWNWDIRGKTLNEVLSNVMNNVADTMVSRYASVMNSSTPSDLTLKVAGISQQADLLQLMRYLQHLTPVAEVQLVSVAGNDIILNVSLRGNKQAFMQAVAGGKNLTLTSKPDPVDDTLQYQWSVK